MTITKEDFFKPGRVSGEEKALTADQVVKQIVAAEAAERFDKTERLRQMREARGADTAARSAAGGKKPAGEK